MITWRGNSMVEVLKCSNNYNRSTLWESEHMERMCRHGSKHFWKHSINIIYHLMSGKVIAYLWKLSTFCQWRGNSRFYWFIWHFYRYLRCVPAVWMIAWQIESRACRFEWSKEHNNSDTASLQIAQQPYSRKHLTYRSYTAEWELFQFHWDFRSVRIV